MKLLLLMLMLTGCAGFQELSPKQTGGLGVVGGVALEKTVKGVKKVFTPDYKLLKRPLEVCDITSETVFVTCYILPCAPDRDCSVRYVKKKWFEDNQKVLTVRRSLLVAVTLFCEKNPEACKKQVGYYEGKKVVIIDE